MSMPLRADLIVCEHCGLEGVGLFVIDASGPQSFVSWCSAGHVVVQNKDTPARLVYDFCTE